jgi:hypothetical protein
MQATTSRLTRIHTSGKTTGESRIDGTSSPGPGWKRGPRPMGPLNKMPFASV